jgi:hypothetical protein
MTSNPLYVAVTWTMSTKRNCNVLGIFHTKRKAADCIIEYLTYIVENTNINQSDQYRIFLMNGFVVVDQECYKVCETKIDDIPSVPFAPDICVQGSVSFNNKFITHINCGSYVISGIKSIDDKIMIYIGIIDYNGWFEFKYINGEKLILHPKRNKWITLDSVCDEDITYDYFDNLEPNFDDNDNFYKNLLRFYEKGELTIEECASELYQKMIKQMNLISDFDRLFSEITDEDLFADNDCVCIKILLLIYHKLYLLRILNEDTVSRFLSAIDYFGSFYDIYDYEDDEMRQLIKKNCEDLSNFVKANNLIDVIKK